jgi:hypothetical protein
MSMGARRYSAAEGRRKADTFFMHWRVQLVAAAQHAIPTIAGNYTASGRPAPS